MGADRAAGQVALYAWACERDEAATRALMAQLVLSGYRVYCCGCGGYFPPGFRKSSEGGAKECDAARNALVWDPSRVPLATVPRGGKFEWGCGQTANRACGARHRGHAGRTRRDNTAG